MAPWRCWSGSTCCGSARSSSRSLPSHVGVVQDGRVIPLCTAPKRRAETWTIGLLVGMPLVYARSQLS